MKLAKGHTNFKERKTNIIIKLSPYGIKVTANFHKLVSLSTNNIISDSQYGSHQMHNNIADAANLIDEKHNRRPDERRSKK